MIWYEPHFLVLVNCALELYMNSVFVAAKHTLIHRRSEVRTFVQIWTKGLHGKVIMTCGKWQFEKKFCSNETMRCDELTFNTGYSSYSKITCVACLHISETMPFVCARNVWNHSHPNGASQLLVIGLLLLHFHWAGISETIKWSAYWSFHVVWMTAQPLSVHYLQLLAVGIIMS